MLFSSWLYKRGHSTLYIIKLIATLLKPSCCPPISIIQNILLLFHINAFLNSQTKFHSSFLVAYDIKSLFQNEVPSKFY